MSDGRMEQLRVWQRNGRGRDGVEEAQACVEEALACTACVGVHGDVHRGQGLGICRKGQACTGC